MIDCLCVFVSVLVGYFAGGFVVVREWKRRLADTVGEACNCAEECRRAEIEGRTPEHNVEWFEGALWIAERMKLRG